MADKILYAFPNTNLFIRCREPHTLDWRALGEFDAIEVIVSRPIQKEIVRQKGRRNARVARRAKRVELAL